MRETFKRDFLNDQSSAEVEKIALKSPDQALSSGNAYWLDQELLGDAIPLSSLLSLHGHCVISSKILDLKCFIH